MTNDAAAAAAAASAETDPFVSLRHEARAQDVKRVRGERGRAARQPAAHEVRRRLQLVCQVGRQVAPHLLGEHLENRELKSGTDFLNGAERCVYTL